MIESMGPFVGAKAMHGQYFIIELNLLLSMTYICDEQYVLQVLFDAYSTEYTANMLQVRCQRQQSSLTSLLQNASATVCSFGLSNF
jgi:hypothetical protein